MASNDTDSRQENGQKVSVSFGIRGDSLVPEEISSLLGMQPSHAFARGDEYHSVTGTRKHPWGVWQLRSETSISSLDVEDHAQFILGQLEPKREIIDRYVENREFYVDVRIWCESDAETIGYTVSSSTIARLAVLCNEFNFSFIGKCTNQ